MVCLLVAFLDSRTSYAVNVALFYFIPILLVTWMAGRNSGLLLSVIASGAWFAVNSFTRPSDISQAMHWWNAGARLITFTGVAYLVSVLKETRMEAEAAKIDPLTGAANFREFRDRAAAEIRRACRYEHPLTVAYVDLDHFKAVNDNFGHATGNEVLRTIADTLKRNIRESDLLARLGGDEFLLLFPETDAVSAPKALQKIQEIISTMMQERNWPVTTSIGVVTFMSPPESVDALLRIADEAMYAAKDAGRNRIAFRVCDQASSPTRQAVSDKPCRS
jgi:diguanylate cyclase (GGDEF)-like protein